MKLPRISDPIQFFECGNAPIAAVVVAHSHGYRGAGRVDLAIFPRIGWPSHEYGVLFVPAGTETSEDRYCAYPPEPIVRTPGNISINVQE